MSVYRRKNSRFWWYSVTTSSGRKRVSTKRTNKREAEAVAAEMNEALNA